MSPDALLARIKYEMTQIQNEYSVIESVMVQQKASLNDIEIRAVASALHAIYNGIEKILMGFRHFFRHSYGFMLDNDLMQPLYADIGPLINTFNDEITGRF